MKNFYNSSYMFFFIYILL